MATNPIREPRRQQPVEPKPTQAPRPFDSRELFGPGDEIVIHHAGDLYRLRRTRNGKLILTK